MFNGIDVRTNSSFPHCSTEQCENCPWGRCDDRPKALNALDHAMIRGLLRLSRRSSRMPRSNFWIESSAEKAFCARGDVRDVPTMAKRAVWMISQTPRIATADEYLLDVYSLLFEAVFAGLMVIS